MSNVFQTAYGTIPGTRHIRAGRNNQDAFAIEIREDVLAAVVADGCSEGLHSEVGAKLAARFISRSLVESASKDSPETILETVRLTLINGIKFLTARLGSEINQTIRDYFLFTVVGAIFTKDSVVTFSIGDGLISINGENLILGPFPGNQPPYMAYGLNSDPRTLPESGKFTIHHHLPFAQVNSVLVATDGVLDLIDAEEKNLPGKNEKLGSLSQFWIDDNYFSNPDTMRRRLFLANQSQARPDWVSRKVIRHEGLLPDDTTMIVIRKKIER